MSKKQIIAHIDMDCFYCSCEIKRKPELKGKPVMVGGTKDRGVISAANYEARAFGVFSATPAAKAKKLCPDGIYIRPDRVYYKNESNKIMSILASIGDEISQVSIDEAYLNLSDFSENFDNLKEMAEFIQKKIKSETLLTCSVGIAESKVAAKIASDYKKPAGITIVDDQKSFLAPLSIGKIPGIGKVAKEHYINENIKTIGDLANLNEFEVIEKFGKNALLFHQVALGLDFSKITKRKSIQSISRETTFKDDIFNTNKIKNNLLKISEWVHKDLKNKSFKTISIKIKYHDFTSITRDKTLNHYSKDPMLIKKLSIELFEKVINEEKNNVEKENIKKLYEKNYMLKPIRLIGVKLSNLKIEKYIQRKIPDYS